MRRARLDERSDVTLIRIAQGGDVSAYETLVRRYQTLAFRTAYVITGEAADAEDVAQDAFIKAWRALDRFDLSPKRGRLFNRSDARQSNADDAAFRPWLLTIVANEARNRQRSKARHPVIELESLEAVLPEGEAAAPEGIAEADEQREELARALNRLSDEDRAVITLRYFLELTEAEMASVLGVARGTVKSRLSRALQRARHLLETSAAPLIEEEKPRG